MQMRYDPVENKQKHNTEPKTNESGQKGPSAFVGALIHSRNKKAPDRCCDHYAARKTGQCALYHAAHLFFHKEHTSRAEHRAYKRDRYSFSYFQPHIYSSFYTPNKPSSLTVETVISEYFPIVFRFKCRYEKPFGANI